MSDQDETLFAFPATFADGRITVLGMTRRDWFAGQALIGVVYLSDEQPEKLAEKAYAIADAMMEARKSHG